MVPKKGVTGRFLSKKPKQLKPKTRRPKKPVALWDIPEINPIRERLARTRTKQGGTGRVHLRKAYKGKARVETREKFTADDGTKLEKLVLRVKGDSNKTREQVKSFLKKYGTGKDARSWVNIGTKETRGGFFGQSKAGTANQTYSYIETGSKEYAKKLGIQPGQKLIFEIVIIRPR